LLSITLTTTETSSTIGKPPTLSPVDISKTSGGHKPLRGPVANDHCYLKCLHVSTALVATSMKSLDDTHLDTPHSVGLCGRLIGPSHRLYLTTHNTYKGQTSMLPTGFEPAIPARELPQTYAFDRVNTGNVRSSKRLSLFL